MLRFSKSYFFMAISLLGVEIVIVRFIHDRFIRPYAGDFLATIFLYCLVRSAVEGKLAWTVGVVVLVSYLVEGLQYVDLLSRLGWQHSRMARMLLGSRFAWGDILAYTLGAAAVLAAERLREAVAPLVRQQPD